jgi:hypothetical protein
VTWRRNGKVNSKAMPVVSYTKNRLSTEPRNVNAALGGRIRAPC